MAFEAIRDEKEGIIRLKDNSTGTEAEIFTTGALLNAFRLRTVSGETNIIDGYDSPADARANLTNGFKSAKLSPFACRLYKGDYRLNDISYHVTGFFLGGHSIHGLLYDKEYKVSDWGHDAEGAFVTLSCEYTGTDAGYPFPFQLEIHWQLQGGNRLSVSTSVRHQNSHVIPYMDGWHPYFTLGGSVDDCTLQFASDQRFVFNEDLIPTGEMTMDSRFINGCPMKGVELDNSFLLETPGTHCVLRNQRLELTISPDASYPVLQVYTPPHRQSIAIENLSGPPDNFNNGIGLLLLEPGKTKTFTTVYSVRELQVD